ncbi:MAG: hypothetical protein A2029_05275 [Chloroflexi bacterium RBG_19FT_COMBO_47_9]|nr:MAG: hypothetical protein A2029_05275 [Chloroflexi bacterium RBG_19FT_COMBO_47_9]
MPNGITANKKTRELTVLWSDKHTSVYPFSLLRYACPCEECRGGHDSMRVEPPREVFYMPIEDKPATRLLMVEEVGSYGISIEWEDGHHLGIYNWHYLRELCPCPICQEMMIYGQ